MKTLTAIIYPGETCRWLVAYNPETGTTTQGKTGGQALRNLKEAVSLDLAEHPAPSRPGAILTKFEVEHAETAVRVWRAGGQGLGTTGIRPPSPTGGACGLAPGRHSVRGADAPGG